MRSLDNNIRAEQLDLRARVVATVKDLVAGSPGPILLARASQHVVSKLGPQVLETQWAGMGSFKRLLQASDNLGLEITTQPEPGYLFDPERHAHPLAGRVRESQNSAPTAHPAEAGDYNGEKPHYIEPNGDDFFIDELTEAFEVDDSEEAEETYDEPLPTLEEFSRRVCQVTGAPDLSSYQYAVVFHGIVHELQQIADGAKVYNTYQSSKAVSDWCAQHGESVSRADMVLIFKGIIFQDGVRFGKRPGSYTAADLASIVRDNIKALCRRSRLELTEYEEHLLDEWILGGLDTEIDHAKNHDASADNHTI